MALERVPDGRLDRTLAPKRLSGGGNGFCPVGSPHTRLKDFLPTVYWPEGNDPDLMYGGGVERIGTWAYVHESESPE